MSKNPQNIATTATTFIASSIYFCFYPLPLATLKLSRLARLYLRIKRGKGLLVISPPGTALWHRAYIAVTVSFESVAVAFAHCFSFGYTQYSILEKNCQVSVIHHDNIVIKSY